MLSASLIDVPRPFVDPIDSLIEALGVLTLALPRPLTHCTLTLVLDSHRRGLGLVRSQTLTKGTMHDLIGDISAVSGATSVVIVSTRTANLISPTDVDDLIVHSLTLINAGLSLQDWIVVGRGGFYCPRSLAGTADPWPSSVACL